MSKKQVGTIVVLFVVSLCASYLRHIVSSKYHFLLTIIMIAGIFLISNKLSLNKTMLGIDPQSFKKAILVALPFMFVVIISMTIAYFINNSLFEDSRYNQPLGSLLWTVFITIPITTVFLEELFFRGLFFGYVDGVTNKYLSYIIPSIAFGLWHFFTSQSVTIASIKVSHILVITGTILLTSLAGGFFILLRKLGSSILTSALVHWTINSTGVVLAYFAWHV